jgi:hypothetical protein
MSLEELTSLKFIIIIIIIIIIKSNGNDLL